jgi:isoleucyl-tRNA synthetase
MRKLAENSAPKYGAIKLQNDSFFDLSGKQSDLYLEGLDQFSGWFYSSLLTAVAIIGKAPYKVPVLGTLRVNFIFRKV